MTTLHDVHIAGNEKVKRYIVQGTGSWEAHIRHSSVLASHELCTYTIYIDIHLILQ